MSGAEITMAVTAVAWIGFLAWVLTRGAKEEKEVRCDGNEEEGL
jgi:hypothetical protein